MKKTTICCFTVRLRGDLYSRLPFLDLAELGVLMNLCCGWLLSSAIFINCDPETLCIMFATVVSLFEYENVQKSDLNGCCLYSLVLMLQVAVGDYDSALPPLDRPQHRPLDQPLDQHLPPRHREVWTRYDVPSGISFEVMWVTKPIFKIKFSAALFNEPPKPEACWGNSS